MGSWRKFEALLEPRFGWNVITAEIKKFLFTSIVNLLSQAHSLWPKFLGETGRTLLVASS